MTTSRPLFAHLPPPAWGNAAVARPAAAPAVGPLDWLGPANASARLSIRHDVPAGRDVEAWAQALVHHLIDTAPPVR